MAADWLADGWLAVVWMLAGWRLAGGWLATSWLALKIFGNLGLLKSAALIVDDDFKGKFRLERAREHLRKRKAMRNINPAIIFSKLEKRKVKINVVLRSHVLLICLKSMLHYELSYPDKNNVKSYTYIES